MPAKQIRGKGGAQRRKRRDTTSDEKASPVKTSCEVHKPSKRKKTGTDAQGGKTMSGTNNRQSRKGHVKPDIEDALASHPKGGYTASNNTKDDQSLSHSSDTVGKRTLSDAISTRTSPDLTGGQRPYDSKTGYKASDEDGQDTSSTKGKLTKSCPKSGYGMCDKKNAVHSGKVRKHDNKVFLGKGAMEDCVNDWDFPLSQAGKFVPVFGKTKIGQTAENTDDMVYLVPGEKAAQGLDRQSVVDGGTRRLMVQNKDDIKLTKTSQIHDAAGGVSSVIPSHGCVDQKDKESMPVQVPHQTEHSKSTYTANEESQRVSGILSLSEDNGKNVKRCHDTTGQDGPHADVGDDVSKQFTSSGAKERGPTGSSINSRIEAVGFNNAPTVEGSVAGFSGESDKAIPCRTEVQSTGTEGNVGLQHMLLQTDDKQATKTTAGFSDSVDMCYDTVNEPLQKYKVVPTVNGTKFEKNSAGFNSAAVAPTHAPVMREGQDTEINCEKSHEMQADDDKGEVRNETVFDVVEEIMDNVNGNTYGKRITENLHALSGTEINIDAMSGNERLDKEGNENTGGKSNDTSTVELDELTCSNVQVSCPTVPDLEEKAQTKKEQVTNVYMASDGNTVSAARLVEDRSAMTGEKGATEQEEICNMNTEGKGLSNVEFGGEAAIGNWCMETVLNETGLFDLTGAFDNEFSQLADTVDAVTGIEEMDSSHGFRPRDGGTPGRSTAEDNGKGSSTKEADGATPGRSSTKADGRTPETMTTESDVTDAGSKSTGEGEESRMEGPGRNDTSKQDAQSTRKVPVILDVPHLPQDILLPVFPQTKQLKACGSLAETTSPRLCLMDESNMQSLTTAISNTTPKSINAAVKPQVLRDGSKKIQRLIADLTDLNVMLVRARREMEAARLHGTPPSHKSGRHQ